MKDQQLNYTIVGASVLVLGGLLLATIIFLSTKLGTSDTYFTTFDNVGGIQYGSRVTYNGYAIGQVTQIQTQMEQDKKLFRLKLAITHDWRIPIDSQARIATSGILSAASIDIQGGQSNQFLEPNEEIISIKSTSLMSTVNKVAESLQTGQLHDVINNMSRVSGDLAHSIPILTANLNQASTLLSHQMINEKNAAQLNEAITNLNQASKNINNLTQTLNQIVSNNRQNINNSIIDAHYSLNALARNIDSILYNLDSTLRNTNEASRQIRQNPAILLKGRATPSDSEK